MAMFVDSLLGIKSQIDIANLIIFFEDWVAMVDARKQKL